MKEGNERITNESTSTNHSSEHGDNQKSNDLLKDGTEYQASKNDGS